MISLSPWNIQFYILVGSSHQAEAQSQSVSIPPELFVESSSALSVANTGRDELAPGNIGLDSVCHGWDKSVGNVHRNSIGLVTWSRLSWQV